MHKFGMLFQGAPCSNSLRVWENVAFGLIQGRGMERAAAKEIALDKLGAVGLGAEVGELRPAELSGGMQKRVALGARDRRRARDHLLRRADHRPRPDHGRRDQRPHHQMRARSGRHRDLDHPRHGQRAQDRRPHRDDPQGRIIWHGPAAEIDRSGNPYVDQFIHGRAEGPIQMEVRAL